MMRYIVLFSWTFFTALAGANVLLIFDRKISVKGLAAIGLSFLLGLGGISMEMLLMGIMGMKFKSLRRSRV